MARLCFIQLSWMCCVPPTQVADLCRSLARLPTLRALIIDSWAVTEKCGLPKGRPTCELTIIVLVQENAWYSHGRSVCPASAVSEVDWDWDETWCAQLKI